MLDWLLFFAVLGLLALAARPFAVDYDDDPAFDAEYPWYEN